MGEEDTHIPTHTLAGLDVLAVLQITQEASLTPVILTQAISVASNTAET